jgi:glycosyltransferase involved in cell wall biosynthesis
MSFLERAGHNLTMYLYSPRKFPVVSVDEVTAMLSETSAYPDMSATFKVYSPEEGIQGDFDAVFAADWETAYAVHRHQGHAKRFYFAQDFEPAFYPWGSDFVLAENTYKLGFHGITAGRWLAMKLINDYGMSCDFYDYAVDKDHYRHLNSNPRNEVMFYARPPTPRRATEFGLLVLTELKRCRPDITVNIVGWDMSGFNIPFEYVNHKALDISQLNEIYNRCAAGLVLSLTNMSLLPMEIMSSGVVPVVNDSPNTRGVFNSEFIEFVPMSPRAMAEKMIEIIERPDAIEHSKVIAQSVLETNWTDPGADFITKFEKAMTSPVPQPQSRK